MDQQPPQMTPPQQPQWSPPPQQPAGWGGPAYGGPPPRPTGVTLTGIFFIVLGVLMVLVALLAFAGGAMFASMVGGAMGGGLFAGLFAFLGVLVLVWAILHLVAGIGTIQGKGWGRWTGIVVAIMAVIFGVLGLVGLVGASTGLDAGSLIFQIAWIVLYGLAAWVLMKASAYFSFRR